MYINCTTVTENFQQKIICTTNSNPTSDNTGIRVLIIWILIVLLISIRTEIIICFRLLNIVFEYLHFKATFAYRSLRDGYSARHPPEDIELRQHDTAYQQI